MIDHNEHSLTVHKKGSFKMLSESFSFDVILKSRTSVVVDKKFKLIKLRIPTHTPHHVRLTLFIIINFVALNSLFCSILMKLFYFCILTLTNIDHGDD